MPSAVKENFHKQCVLFISFSQAGAAIFAATPEPRDRIKPAGTADASDKGDAPAPEGVWRPENLQIRVLGYGRQGQGNFAESSRLVASCTHLLPFRRLRIGSSRPGTNNVRLHRRRRLRQGFRALQAGGQFGLEFGVDHQQAVACRQGQ